MIETGSLISIKENVSTITIPSEEEKIKMYPLNFEEFMLAKNEKILISHIKDCFEKKIKLDRFYHNKAMRIFYEYLLVGGMPQSVTEYLENNLSFCKSDKAKRDILSLYEDDIKKSRQKYSSKVETIFSHIPSNLSTHEKKLKLNTFDQNGKFCNYDESLYWLGDSIICNLCYKTNDPNVGFSLTLNDNEVKCYLGDTGLLFSQAFNENQIKTDNLYNAIISGKLSINKGMLLENYVAQALTSMSKKLFFYTHYSNEKHRNDIEIDFLISNEVKTNLKIIPIEVKSSANYTTTSLDKFKEKFKNRVYYSIIIHPKEFSIDHENKTIKIPPYMVPFIDSNYFDE